MKNRNSDSISQTWIALCNEGFALHVAANLSQVGDTIHEALTKYLAWTIIYHNKP